MKEETLQSIPQKYTRKLYEKLFVITLETQKMNKFSERYVLLKLNYEYIENMNIFKL